MFGFPPLLREWELLKLEGAAKIESLQGPSFAEQLRWEVLRVSEGSVLRLGYFDVDRVNVGQEGPVEEDSATSWEQRARKTLGIFPVTFFQLSLYFFLKHF